MPDLPLSETDDERVLYGFLMLAEAGKVRGDARDAILARMATRMLQWTLLLVGADDLVESTPKELRYATPASELLPAWDEEDLPQGGEVRDNGSSDDAPERGADSDADATGGIVPR